MTASDLKATVTVIDENCPSVFGLNNLQGCNPPDGGVPTVICLNCWKRALLYTSDEKIADVLRAVEEVKAASE